MGDAMSFDRMAADYDRARPPYPRALYEHLRELGVLRKGVRVLEVGAGTGQATGEFVANGGRVVAVEPGPAMASRLGQRFPDVVTLVSTLEEADLGRARFDVAISATAFHWVDLRVGLPKLHEALVPGGLLAVWRTIFGDPQAETPFRLRVAEITARRPRPPTPRPDPLDTDEWMRTLTADDRFEPVVATRFPWQIDLTTQQVRDLFGTFSDWSAEEVDEAGASVEALGGRVTEHYVTVLCVCRARVRSGAGESGSPPLRR